MRANSRPRFYGESKLKIRAGEVNRESIPCFWRVAHRYQGLVCATASVRMFGEAKVSLNATDEVHLTGLGETNVSVKGDAIISKGLVIGHASVARE